MSYNIYPNRNARIQAMADCGIFIEAHLFECCQELLDWQNTCILREGRVRELSRMLEKAGIEVSKCLDVAEALVKNAALVRCAERKT